jgi:hypothetical protein
MHIIFMVISLVGLGLFWWHRLNAAGEAVRNIADVAGRARGAARRRSFRNRAAESPFAAIDDPVVGGATVVVTMAEELGGFDGEAERRLRDALRPVAKGEEHLDEAVIYAKWAAGHCVESSTAIRHVAPILNEALSNAERAEFLRISDIVLGGTANEAARQALLRSLRVKLKV